MVLGVVPNDRWGSKSSWLAGLTRMENLENKGSVTEAERFHAEPAPCDSEGKTGARHPLALGEHLGGTVLRSRSQLRRNDMFWKLPLYCTLVRISPHRAVASREYE